MSSQLDILALEPFFGGGRRVMLETVMRNSRHRWMLLRLPPRRVERRLAAAAQWFAEQLTRHWVGRVDLVFTSEAMNLSDLHRLMPQLVSKPSVVYFHDNELPLADAKIYKALDLVNLTTAQAASQLWFNSLFHLRTFLERAAALVERHPELSAQSPMAAIMNKSHVLFPPDELGLIKQSASLSVERNPRTIFVDTRDADFNLLNAGLAILAARGEVCQLITVGPVEGLATHLPRRTVGERDWDAQVIALYQSGIHLSARPGAMADYHAVRALSVGCWPVYPRRGVYQELLPESMHPSCLYDPENATSLADRVLDSWQLARVEGFDEELTNILKRFDSIAACKSFDHHLEALADHTAK